MRRMLVSRSSREKPRPLLRLVRTTSPSRWSTRMPRRSSSGPTISAIVLLPAPDSPVNQSVNPWFSCGTCGDPFALYRLVVCSGSVAVEAALHLARSLPAAGSLVRSLLDRLGAGHTADRRESVVVQRVVGDAVPPDIAPHVAVRPVHQRLHLHHAAALIYLDFRAFSRVVDCSRRIPVIHASMPSSAWRSGATFRMPQHASGSRSHSRSPCTAACSCTDSSGSIRSNRTG